MYLATLAPTIPVAHVVDLHAVVIILTYLFLVDFATGVFASYLEWKKTASKGSLFLTDADGWSSDKFKKCFYKVIIYLGVPLIVYQFQKVFLLKNLKFESITESEIDVTTFFIIIFCLNETYSIVFENLPRCGFDAVKRIRKITSGISEAKEAINLKKDSNE